MNSTIAEMRKLLNRALVHVDMRARHEDSQVAAKLAAEIKKFLDEHPEAA